MCTLLVAGGVAGEGARAAEWSAEPAFSLAADLDTNRRLTERAEDSQSARMAASLDLERVTEVDSFSLSPRFEARRHDRVNEALDSNDRGIDAAYRRSAERHEWSLRASAGEDSTLTTELSDTGIVEGRARRRTLSSGSDFTLQTGERSEWQFGVNWTDVDFDDAAGTGLTPYRYPAAFVGLGFQGSDRSRFTFTADAGRLDVPQSGLRIDNLALRGAWRTNLSERLVLDLSAGLNRTASDGQSDQGPVFAIEGSWKGPRATWTLKLDRDVEPSARGRMVEADSVRGSWRWQSSEHTWLTLGLQHLRRVDLLFGLFPERREYSTAHASLGWQMSPHWTAELRAGATRQTYELLDRVADGERAELAIYWSPRRMAMAR